MSKLVVVGSSNTDMVVKAQHFPSPGETVMGGEFFMFPGGKGANQAVAAARVGAKVSFLCCVGDDLFGTQAIEGFQAEGIDTSFIRVLPGQTSGVALIIVNQEGENEIVVAPGTNNALRPEALEQETALLSGADIILTQLETPKESIEFLARHCATHGIPLILNPAPARELPDPVFHDLFMITPNQSETLLFTGIDVVDTASAAAACDVLQSKGVREIVITMGKLGAYYSGSQGDLWVEAHRVQAVDTTAAGDVFNGILAACLSKGTSIKEALDYAARGAAIAVTRMGAQTSAPYKHEIPGLC